MKNGTKPDIYPVQNIAVEMIDPSPANKRRFSDDDKSLRELGDSIESQGLLQAIVIRKNPVDKKRYELVAGERRWRAFRLMGWSEIPAVIRELSDAEAHDITTTENLQREDLSPIEEAESIQVLLADGRSAKEIADRLGKPVSWVARRARIAELSPKWLKAIADPGQSVSKWSATHLELIARYDHKMQDELFGEFKYHAMISVKELEKALNEKHRVLSSAPWKLSDEILIPAAGACTQCQKRTGCELELFEPIEDKAGGSKDRCLDRECWGKKLVAYHEIGIKNAREKHQNLILLDKAGSGLLGKHPWEKALVEEYKFEASKKTDKKAVPAYIIDGPGAGRIEWKKLKSWYEKEAKKQRKVGPDGKPEPKSLEERREGLQKRRVIRYISKLILLLRGGNPDHTGLKPGTCRVCGCTEENCTQCVEKTGSPCHWVNSEKTLCSACEEKIKKELDPRIAIVENLAHIEVHALVAAFGAAQVDPDNDCLNHEFDRWKIYSQVIDTNGGDAMRMAAYGAFDRIVDNLRQITNSPEPEIDFPDSLCAALRLDREEIWSMVLEEIPEPKGWAKLEEPGKKPEKKANKKKSLSDLVGDEIGPADDIPAKRYIYQEHEIFVSAGLGGKQFGTFRVSNGGSGLKRIVSKHMPMVADRAEAQRNLDKFAEDNGLVEVAPETPE